MEMNLDKDLGPLWNDKSKESKIIGNIKSSNSTLVNNKMFVDRNKDGISDRMQSKFKKLGGKKSFAKKVKEYMRFK